MYGLDLSAVEAMADMVFGVADGGKICRRDTGAGFAPRGTLYIGKLYIDHLIIRSSSGTLKRTNMLQADIISAGHKSHR